MASQALSGYAMRPLTRPTELKAGALPAIAFPSWSLGTRNLKNRSRRSG